MIVVGASWAVCVVEFFAGAVDVALIFDDVVIVCNLPDAASIVVGTAAEMVGAGDVEIGNVGCFSMTALIRSCLLSGMLLRSTSLYDVLLYELFVGLEIVALALAKGQTVFVRA